MGMGMPQKPLLHCIGIGGGAIAQDSKPEDKQITYLAQHLDYRLLASRNLLCRQLQLQLCGLHQRRRGLRRGRC